MPSTAVAVRVKPVIPGVPGNVGKLPGGWRLITGQDGKPYYFNKKTGETSWDPPPPSADGDDGETQTPNSRDPNPNLAGPPPLTLALALTLAVTLVIAQARRRTSPR